MVYQLLNPSFVVKAGVLERQATQGLRHSPTIGRHKQRRRLSVHEVLADNGDDTKARGPTQQGNASPPI
jgi:hypothetical protein